MLSYFKQHQQVKEVTSLENNITYIYETDSLVHFIDVKEWR